MRQATPNPSIERTLGRTMRHLLLIVALMMSVPVHAETVFFAGRVAQVDVPKEYEHFFEERGKTLVLLPKTQRKVEVRMTFNSLREYVRQRPSIGKDFIQDAARKKGKAIFPVEQNGAIAFVDFTEPRITQSGERLQNTHGMMGLDDGYVTFTVTATEENANSEFVRRLLADGIKELLGRIRSAT